MSSEQDTQQRLYDDDNNDFGSNIPQNGEGKIPESLRVSQPIAEASTYDLMRELTKRFDHFILMGKRHVKSEIMGKDREIDRDGPGEVDNRMMISGDIHVLTGQTVQLQQQLDMFMEMGYELVRSGFAEEDGEIIEDYYEYEEEDDEGDEWKNGDSGPSKD